MTTTRTPVPAAPAEAMALIDLADGYAVTTLRKALDGVPVFKVRIGKPDWDLMLTWTLRPDSEAVLSRVVLWAGTGWRELSGLDAARQAIAAA